MPTNDREQQFERALARHLSNASPDSVCPDAEALAAYHERTLSLEEMARWKEHIAGCTRCQESLALVEQSENVRVEEWEHQNVPVPPQEMVLQKSMRPAGASVRQEEEALKTSPGTETARPIRKATGRPHLRWVVPIGALAASVIAWVQVREIRSQRSHPMESVQMAQNRQAAPQAPAASYGAADHLRKEEPLAKELDKEIRPQRVVPSPASKMVAPQGAGSAEALNAPPPAAFERLRNTRKDSGISGAAKVAAPRPTPPSSSPLAGSQAKEIVSATTADATAPGVGAGTGLGAAIGNGVANEKKSEQVPRVAQTVTVQSEAAAVDTTGSSTSALTSSSAELQLNAHNSKNLVQLAAGDHRLIVAPGEKYVWRVGDAGKIERSIDRGKTWKLQKSGLTADLTAGSATSDRVCWVVGKAGTVLLTTDGGKRWKQIYSPTTEDLGGIHAIDAQRASIWDVPNRKTFETSDGGATWRQTSSE
jgi:hypothetical protein